MLRHSSDSEPGYYAQTHGPLLGLFRRRQASHRSRYDRPAELDRSSPAYKDAWFCKDPDGHLQATGIDDRGRKQYRYHPDFRAKAESSKFAGLAEFGTALPKIRRKVDKDLKKRALSKDKVVAAVIRLLDEEYLRVGNQEYAKQNKSFGATTLLSRQVHDDGRKVKMRFKGKSGVQHEVTITDRTLRRVVRQLQELPARRCSNM